MLNKKGTVYIDKEQSALQGWTFFISEDGGEIQNVVFTGKVFAVMPNKDKEERVYQILAGEYDLHFIFRDHMPELTFYPVPMLEIFAVDSNGGCYGSTCAGMNILEEDAPIYYIDVHLQSYYLAANLREFLSHIVLNSTAGLNRAKAGEDYLVSTLHLNLDENIKRGEKKGEEAVRIYPSFEEAKKHITVNDIEQLCRLNLKIREEGKE